MLDWLFPKQSLQGNAGAWMTPKEVRLIPVRPVRIEKDLLESRGVSSLDLLVAAATYDDSPLLKTAIHRMKYKGVGEYGLVLSSFMIEALPLLPMREQTALCPVPLHWTRYFQRGFNQAQVLAEQVADACQKSVQPLLVRTRATGHQSRRNRAQRMRALRGAFAMRATNIPRHVVLIDDVATTGATLDACARALKRDGVERVDALVIALG